MWPDTKVPVCRVVSAGVHVLWLDNFSKFCAVAVQGLDKCAAAVCLWTTRGLHRHVGPGVLTALLPSVRDIAASLSSPAAS